MRKFAIIEELENILSDAPAAASIEADRDSGPFRVFLRIHLPFLLIFPVFFLTGPFGPLFLGSSRSWKGLIPAMVLVSVSLLLALTFDRILSHRIPPATDISDTRVPRNVALHLHIPVTASGIFFFIHPAFGFIMLFLSIGLSIQRSIRMAARLHDIGRRRSLVYYLNGVLGWSLLLTSVLFVLNIMKTFSILSRIGF